MSTVKEAINSLGNSFAEFKSVNNERLQKIENTGQTDSLLEHKLSKISDDIDRFTGVIDKISATKNRPDFDVITQDIKIDEHKSAFMSYVRKGDEQVLQSIESKALSVGSDPNGGFLVPKLMAKDMVTVLSSNSVMRQLANVISISTEAIEMLVDKNDAETGWVAESAARDETVTPELAKIRIPVHEIYAKPKATQKLLDDSSINVEQWLSEKIATRMAQIENQSFVLGDGNGKPKGFLAYDLSPNPDWGRLHAFTTGANGGFAKEVAPADFLIDMVNSLKPGYLSGAKWLMSRSALSVLRKLKDATGNYLWHPGLDGTTASKLLGYEVVISDDMPTLDPRAGTRSVAFGNFKEAYTIVDRQGTRVLRDPYTSKPYVEFYVTKRVGGDLVNSEALKILNFSA